MERQHVLVSIGAPAFLDLIRASRRAGLITTRWQYSNGGSTISSFVISGGPKNDGKSISVHLPAGRVSEVAE